MPAEPKRLSRAELYRLVSDAPLSKVAPTLGISGTQLAALCRAHTVPYPGSAYWTRKGLGLEVELEALAEVVEPALDLVAIPRPSPKRGAPARHTATVEQPVPIALVEVSGKPVRPHWLVAEWIEERARQRREALNSREEWRVRNAPPAWTDLDKRRHRLLDAIFKAVEQRGGTISKGEKGLARATIDGEKIDFLIREKGKQVKLPPTDSRRSYMSTDLVGTGMLVFSIKTYLRGPHNEEWRETDRKSLESMLTAFVDRLFEGAQILKAWHIEQEADRRRRAEESARREELERQRADDAARRAKLIELATQWRKAQTVSDMMAALSGGENDPSVQVQGRTIEEWRAWARSFIAELREPVASLDKLFDVVGKTKARPY